MSDPDLPTTPTGRVLVVGGANLDVVARSDTFVEEGTSNPGRTHLAPGGVGRNVAEALARLAVPVSLVAAVGDDAFGDRLLTATAEAGVDVSGVRRVAEPTGTYTALLDEEGELFAAVSDMRATDTFEVGQLDLAGVGVVVLDGNLSLASAVSVARQADAAGIPLVLEPVSAPKARRLRPVLAEARRWLAVTPDRYELISLTGVGEVGASIATLHEAGVEHVWVRGGITGSTLATRGTERVLVPALPATVLDVTGAGDCMLAAFLARLLAGASPTDAVRAGHRAALAAVTSPWAVPPDLARSLEDL